MSAPEDFWSRRRAGVAAEQAAEMRAAEEAEQAAQQAAAEARPDAEILAELNLPDPDQLQAGDDVSGFMAQAVPDRLRRRALRRLWRLNPVLANVDGLVDYGEDFTDAATVIEGLQTAYQVGKGMKAHIDHLAAQEAARAEALARAEDPETEEEIADPVAPESALLAEDAPRPDDADAAPAARDDAGAAEETQEEQSDTRYVASVYRRMRFEFDG